MHICVDLDGTLLNTDTFHEAILQLLKRNAFYFFLIIAWCFRGRAYCKQQVTQRVSLDPKFLPANKAFIDWLQQQKINGEKLILVTAADQNIAEAVANYYGLFEAAYGSDGTRNLKGQAKADFLNQTYGEKGYIYAGNSRADLPIWQSAKAAVLVNTSKSVAKRARKLVPVVANFTAEPLTTKGFLKAIRAHQYTKNLLIFLPWLLGGWQLGTAPLQHLLLGFISMSFLASSVYMANDLLDLNADRQHHSKCRRALASGAMPIQMGVIISIAALAIAIWLASYLSLTFQIIFALYYTLTWAYSLKLKRLILIDVYTLAILFTLRVLAGMALLGLGFSHWLILFSFFFFTNLAFIKRYTELWKVANEAKKKELQGRSYHIEHLNLIKILGVGCGFLSILVFSLYLSSPKASLIYQSPVLLYGLCPMLLGWISMIWLKASEGKMHDDPIVFALKDKASYMVAAACAIIVLAAIVL